MAQPTSGTGFCRSDMLFFESRGSKNKTPGEERAVAGKPEECAVEKRQIAHSKAIEEHARLRTMLAPYVGGWVALSPDWSRVIAAHPDHVTCMREAKEKARPGEVPCFYRIPAVGP